MAHDPFKTKPSRLDSSISSDKSLSTRPKSHNAPRRASRPSSSHAPSLPKSSAKNSSKLTLSPQRSNATESYSEKQLASNFPKVVATTLAGPSNAVIVISSSDEDDAPALAARTPVRPTERRTYQKNDDDKKKWRPSASRIQDFPLTRIQADGPPGTVNPRQSALVQKVNQSNPEVSDHFLQISFSHPTALYPNILTSELLLAVHLY